jgi:serine protease Do
MTRIRTIQFSALAALATFALTVLTILSLTNGQTTKTPSGTSQPLSSTMPLTSTPTTPPLPLLSRTASDDNLRVTNDVRVYDAVKDAVVNITSSHTVSQRVSTGNPVFDMMPLEMLPPNLLPRAIGTAQLQSLGSGFVIHPAGYIITNEHVIEQGTDIQCVFSNGDKLEAQVIATDEEHDLAVLKVSPPKPLKAMALGASEDLHIGEPAYAIGNPFGYAGTMTRGIISAVNRTLNVSQSKTYTGLIQTDASINPGNSGGPLLNAYGEVIGVNTAIRADARGIGFAISISNMRDLLPAFLNPEVLNRAQVGFSLEEIRHITPPATVSAEIRVKSVQPGSAADKQGLKPNDLITSINGVKPTSIVDALVALANSKPGDNLGILVQRPQAAATGGGAGESKELAIRFPVTKAPPPPTEALLLSKMGIKGQTVTPTLVSKFHLAASQGVYVDTVEPNSPAAKIGIQTGDVLIQLGRYRLNSTDDLATLLKSVSDPVNAYIALIRGNTRATGTISLK